MCELSELIRNLWCLIYFVNIKLFKREISEDSEDFMSGSSVVISSLILSASHWERITNS